MLKHSRATIAASSGLSVPFQARGSARPTTVMPQTEDMPERLDEEELADWRAGRNAVYQLAALTVGARLAVAEG